MNTKKHTFVHLTLKCTNKSIEKLLEYQCKTICISGNTDLEIGILRTYTTQDGEGEWCRYQEYL